VSAPGRGLRAAVGVECRKALAQWQYRIVLIVCAVAPVAFAAALDVQGTVPSDTLFGRLVFDSGLAIPLVVLGFAGLWGLPVVAAATGGDMFASEDRYRTWPTMLTRSRSRGEVFAAKVVVACGFTVVAVMLLGASAIAAGALVVGVQPLVDLSGMVLAPADALPRIALSWISVLPPCLAITAAALFTSVATRSSIAGVGGPVVVALLLQVVGFVDLPAPLRVAVPTTALEAWHGLMAHPAFLKPLAYGTIVNLGSAAVLLALARRMFLRRDIA
jgi:ABC-2 type transport system permease protein